MRKLVEFDDIKNDMHFWIFFLLSGFPESLEEETDMTLSEIIQDSYEINQKWADDFTGYYDTVFEENDGYIEEPNTLVLPFMKTHRLFIEFHPGDMLYFIDDTEIGCTGPHCRTHVLSWQQFCLYTDGMKEKEELLFVPMLRIDKSETEKLYQVVYQGLKMTMLQVELERICRCIVSHCLSMGSDR